MQLSPKLHLSSKKYRHNLMLGCFCAICLFNSIFPLYSSPQVSHSFESMLFLSCFRFICLDIRLRVRAWKSQCLQLNSVTPSSSEKEPSLLFSDSASLTTSLTVVSLPVL